MILATFTDYTRFKNAVDSIFGVTHSNQHGSSQPGTVVIKTVVLGPPSTFTAIAMTEESGFAFRLFLPEEPTQFHNDFPHAISADAIATSWIL